MCTKAKRQDLEIGVGNVKIGGSCENMYLFNITALKRREAFKDSDLLNEMYK